MAIAAAALVQTACPLLGVPYDTLDCQAFVERALADAGVKLNLPGANAWYRRMSWTGTPEECKATFGGIPRGAFLFILEKDGKEPAKYRNDGIGNASHIGIYTGLSGKQMQLLAEEAGNAKASHWIFGDGAIHSSSTRQHVATSAFAGKTIRGGWNRVGLWSRLDYGEQVNARLAGDPATPRPQEGGKAMEKLNPTEAVVTRAPDTKPDTNTVNLRYYPTTGSALMVRVPFDQKVTALAREDVWTQICWIREDGASFTGWMQSQYLKLADVDPAERHVYTITFTGTEAEAQALLSFFGAGTAALEEQVGRG